MPRTVRTVVRTFNKDLFIAELNTVLPILGTTIAGFERSSDRLIVPIGAAKVVSRRQEGGNPVVEEIAQPGELWIETAVAPTVAELAAIDQVLVDHDENARTAGQVEFDRDEANLDRLTSDFNNWDLLTPHQKDQNQKLLNRLLVRKERRGSRI